MSLTRLKQLMVEGTDDELLQYLRQLGLGLGAPLVGVPFPFPVSQLPSDVFPNIKGMVFMKANGQSFDKELYPDCAIVYPTGTLPDLRGEFIRGWDDGRNVDTGRALLSTQNDAFKSHGHYFDRSWALSGFDPTGGYDLVSGDATGVAINQRTRSTIEVGGSETRPRNVAFAYMIRVK